MMNNQMNISVEDIVTIAKAFSEGTSSDKELSDEELETVAGGKRDQYYGINIRLRAEHLFR